MEPFIDRVDFECHTGGHGVVTGAPTGIGVTFGGRSCHLTFRSMEIGRPFRS
jgi:hypothetical protein